MGRGWSRRRGDLCSPQNLGPILDANGWAVNTLTRVNVPLGGSLTSLPRIPPGSDRTLVDPYAPKKSPWPMVIVVLLVLVGFGGIPQASLPFAQLEPLTGHRFLFDGPIPSDSTRVISTQSLPLSLRRCWRPLISF
ncbi:MAG: hypothetical protein HC794_06710 [Nitrospiraceae bacterium]|nr:hypothetical protein [Nitrospiraceae bacterium]